MESYSEVYMIKRVIVSINISSDVLTFWKVVQQTKINKPQRKKFRNFTHIQMTSDRLVSICVGRPNGELACKFEPDQRQRKSTQVVGQTKRKLIIKASRKLAASTCSSVQTCVNLSADLRIRLATHRKSVRKFRFCNLL